MTKLRIVKNNQVPEIKIRYLAETPEAVGTGALKTESVVSEPGQGPWISVLVVEKNRRRNGIGTALIFLSPIASASDPCKPYT